MKAEGNWKTEGIVIDTPAYEFPFQINRKKRKKNEEDKPEEEPNGKWILPNQIPLSPLQAEEEDRKRRLSQVYETLFQDRMDKMVEEPIPPKISPVSIPAGDYLTVAQTAGNCKVTVKKVNNWID